jgi:hypothetical protein
VSNRTAGPLQGTARRPVADERPHVGMEPRRRETGVGHGPGIAGIHSPTAPPESSGNADCVSGPRAADERVREIGVST